MAKQNNYIVKILNHSWIIVSAIVVIGSLIYLYDSDLQEGFFENLVTYGRNIFRAFLWIIIVVLFPVYFTLYRVIPNFLLQKKYFLLTLSGFGLVIIWGFLTGYITLWIHRHWFDLLMIKNNPWHGSIWVMVVFILTVFMNLFYRQNIKQSKEKQLENEKLKAELDLLKSQINPHFFFNSLNNIYSLSLEKSTEIPNLVLNLSELIRHSIYESRKPFISIYTEIRYLESYLALQQIRINLRKSIVINKVIQNENADIAPMILIAFLENAFKHGIEKSHGQALLDISLLANSERILFRVKNSFLKSEHIKIGSLELENVKKRLSRIYKNSHSLSVEEDKTFYTISLEILLPKQNR